MQTNVNKSRSDSVEATARRILNAQLLLMEANAERAARIHSVKAVHDLRVAIRRFRVALRVFGDLMPHTVVKRLRRRFQWLSHQLSPIRDAQVWHGWLARTVGRRKAPLPAELHQCVKEAETACLEQVQTLDQVLKGAPFRVTRKCCQRLRCDRSARPFLAGKLHRAYERLCRAGVSLVDAKGEQVHTLRRRCRRLRYLSEFAEPMLGRSVHKLTHHLKHVSTALGERHDAEVQLRILNDMERPPEDLCKMVTRRKHEARTKFTKAWRKLMASHFRQRVLAELQAAKQEGTGI